MRIYFAPLESITLSEYRNTFDSYFRGPDAYFIPFLSPMSSLKLGKKDEKEIQKESNHLSKPLIPQIISKHADETLWLIEHLKQLGYQEANLNFGCPSGTVASKGKGSGMLKDLSYLKAYLDEVFSKNSLPVSIKTRIGFNDVSNWEEILSLYNQYPIKELIIHPRSMKEGYIGKLHLDIFDKLNEKTNIPIIYNGEVKGKEDILLIQKAFPYLKGIMMGRGFLEYPDALDDSFSNDKERKEAIHSFIFSLMETYSTRLGWGNASFPIKEQWNYLHKRFLIEDPLYKKLMKQKDKDSFYSIAEEIFQNHPLKQSPDFGLARYFK